MNVTYTAALSGLFSQLVRVEVSKVRGTPQLILIGLAGKTIVESRERIRSALVSCGIRIPSSRIVINLAPADIPKVGSHYELAICAALLISLRRSTAKISNTLFLGELSLDGSIKPVRGALAMITGLSNDSIKTIVLPHGNLGELSLLSDYVIHPVRHISELIDYLYENKPLSTDVSFVPPPQNSAGTDSFSNIRGQELAKRALEIAAAGGHNVLMTGPPGAGKSMLAKALPSILPPLTKQESIEVTALHSLCGLTQSGYINQRPYRSPHHATSRSGLLGGHSPIKPGELSLAHRGVLFLDELPEFSRDCLESLRQPLEDGQISIVRAQETVIFPAVCSIIAAANPCPCGYSGSIKKVCVCSPTTIHRYQRKLSGPLLDRFDLHVELPSVNVSLLSSTEPAESSIQIQGRVMQARARQSARYKASTVTNATISSQQLHQSCVIDKKTQQFLTQAAHRLNLSARNYFRTIKVARTIADLSSSDTIKHQHVAEALQFRSKTN